MMTKSRKTVSYILKTIVIISAAVGTLISDLVIGRPFSVICRGFMYFTAQSNILIALICLTGACLMIRDKAVSDVWRIIKFVGTVAITLTGFVYIAILVPSFLHQTWTLKNTLTHILGAKSTGNPPIRKSQCLPHSSCPHSLISSCYHNNLK